MNTAAKPLAAVTILCCTLLLPAASRGAATTAPGCDAKAILAQMRPASGGANWERVREVSAWGAVTTGGLHGTARYDQDLTQGRYARRYDVEVQGRSATVFDGTTLWSQDISGGVHPLNSAFPRANAITDAYLARYGYFTPSGDVAVECRGTRTENGQQLDIVRVQPRGGIPADLAIDASSHVLASVTETLPITTLTTRYSDYRKVNGLLLPFTITSGTTEDPSDADMVHVTRYDVRRNDTAADFTRPKEINPAMMAGNASSTTVPISLEAHQLIIWASINGRKPLPFILDTGGHEILTTGAAKTLGLRGRGAGASGGSGSGTISLQYTHVDSVRIGDAELRNQPFLIIPYNYAFYERGRKTPLAGIIGLEFFERYAIRIDYPERKLTLTPFANFHYAGDGTPVRFTFQEDMPMVEAAADGHSGLFGTDTGNSGSLILFGRYLARTGLDKQYTKGFTIIGRGTGGSNTGRLQTLARFTVGGHDIHGIPADFTNMTSGAFSSWTEGGNIGYQVLSRFIPVYDYANEILYLEPSPNAGPLQVDHSGMGFIKDSPDAFDIALVRPNSPAAAAGIVAGDKILAVNGKPAADLSRSDVVELTYRAGTVLDLRVQHGSAVHNVALHLTN